MMEAGITVARTPKPEPKKVAKKKPGPKPVGRRPSLIAVKCHKAYKDHLETIAEAERVDIPVIIDKALMAYAVANGYGPFPKR
jgi:hypothetical protein